MDANTKDVLMIAIPALTGVATAWVAFKVREVASGFLRFEKAANGTRDALVAEAHAKGKEEERAEQKARDAATENR